MRLDSALLLYTLGGLLFSLAGLLFKPLSGIFSSVEIAAWRSLTALAAVFVIRRLAGFSFNSLPISWSRWQLFSSCAFSFQTIFFSIAIMLISTADTFLISNAAPVYLVLWQYVFEKKIPTRTELAIVGIALLGLSLFLFDSLTVVSGTSQYFGLGAALIAGLSFSGHIYAQSQVGKEGMKNGERLTQGSVILGTILTCLLTFPLSAVYPGPRLTAAPLWSYSLILALGIFQLAIPITLWARTLPSIPPLLAAFMPTLIAVWAPLWTNLVLEEPFPGVLALFGAVIVHLTVIFASVRRAKFSQRAAPLVAMD